MGNLRVTGLGSDGRLRPQSPALIRLTPVYQKGSTNTYVFRLPAATETRGEAGFFTITDSSTNGGYISVPRDSLLFVKWAMYNASGAAQNCQVMVGASLVNSANQGESELRASGFIANNTYPIACATPVWLPAGEKLFFTAPFTPHNSVPLLNMLTVSTNF